ncbi:Methyladenine glycosylase-domain-containing protein [Chytriomyces sp. MP71]|nr:Methyladenine glycosylase-domain-containing protein [Chytriomyces sp. MP71]
MRQLRSQSRPNAEIQPVPPIKQQTKKRKVIIDAPKTKKQKGPPPSPPKATPAPGDGIVRCKWSTNDPIYIEYHDSEWGDAVHSDQKLFEMLLLEGAQAGLNWLTILKRREGYRAAFAGFDAKAVAAFSEEQVQALVSGDTGIIRNRAKVASAVTNAKVFLCIQEEFGSFDAYIWKFAPAVRDREDFGTCRATSPESHEMSKDLKKRGMGFVGPTICYAFMQAVGMVNDHEEACFKRSDAPSSPKV